MIYNDDDDDNNNVYSPQAVAGFSSQGPTQDGRLKPDVVLPGWWVTSASSQTDGNYYCHVMGSHGTSMSAPQAASYAVKIRQYFVEGYYPSGAKTQGDGFVPSGALLKGMLIHSAMPITLIMNFSVPDPGKCIIRVLKVFGLNLNLSLP